VGFVIILSGLPVTLKDGDTHSEYTELAASGYAADDTVKQLQAWDSTGKNGNYTLDFPSNAVKVAFADITDA
jgi:hypothetical protein